MDLAALKTELALPTYSGMSDAQAANALNNRTIASGDGALVRIGDFFTKLPLADATSILDKLVTGAATQTNAKWMLELLRGDGLKLGIQQTTAMLNQLVTATVITGPDRTKIRSLGEGYISRSEQLFGTGNFCSPEEVAAARALA